MKKKIIKNYIYNLLYQIIVIILPIITTPYLSRVLGADKIGIYSYTISITTYFILFGSLGIAMYAQREFAYVQEDKKKRSNLFFEVFILRALTLFFSIIIFYFLFARSGQYNTYYKILILEIIAVIFDISSFFQGMEEFKKVVKRNLIIKCLSVVCVFLFIKTPEDITKYFYIYVFSNLLGNFSLWLYIPKYLVKVQFNKLRPFRHVKSAIMLFIPQIAIQIYTVLDKTMIGTLVYDKSEVGYYEQSQKIVKMVQVLVTSLGTVMLPRIANDFANGNIDKIKKSLLTSFNFVYAIALPLMFGIIAVSNDFIPWFLGEDFYKSKYIVCIMSLIVLFVGLSNVIGTQYLLPIKRQKEYTISVVIGSIVNVCLNVVLIPKLYSIGAAIATIIAEFFVTLIQFIFISKDFRVKDILLMSLKYLISSIAMFLIILLLNNLFVRYIDKVILRIIIDIVIGISIYLFMLFVLREKFIVENLKLIIKKLKFIENHK